MAGNMITANYDSEGKQTFDPSQNPSAGNIVTSEVNQVTGRVKNLKVSGRKVRALGMSGNVGTRMLSMRMGAFDNTTVKTFRAIIEVAAGEIDAVRPIFANGATGATYTVASCAVRAIPNLTDALPAGTAVVLPSSGVVPVAPNANRRGYMLGNWTDLASVPRTDGGKGALVVIDAYITTAGSINIMGNGGSDNFLPWATRPNRKWIMRHNDGDCITTPANFVSTTNRIQSPIVGLQYAARGRVITVMGVGDSITDGRGTYIGEGFGVPACESLSVGDGVVYEWANLGWATAPASSFRKSLGDAVAAGIIPDVVVAPIGSPDSFNPPIDAAEITSCRAALSEIWRTARDNQIVPIFWTILPTNSAVKNYGASDALRVAYNAAALSYPDAVVLDFSAALSGVANAAGQVEFSPGVAPDGIHPGYVGNAIIWAILSDELKAIF